MSVSKKHHYRIVITLATTVVSLLIILLFGYIHYSKNSDDQNTNIDYNNLPGTDLRASASPFLQQQEVAIVPTGTTTNEEIILPIDKVVFEYIEVTGGCGTHFEGECLNARSGPGKDFPAVNQLRNGIVLKVAGQVERDGELWYKIDFDEWLRYPERLNSDWYVSADYVKVLLDEGEKTAWEEKPVANNKKIVVDISSQILYAYNPNGELFIQTKISTGLEFTPTPIGTFTIFKKTPSRYMQGPIPGLADQQSYDLPGVPWNLYFTEGGAVIHGAYWHDSFGSQYSHGCVNLPLKIAEDLYKWADLGTKIVVQY